MINITNIANRIGFVCRSLNQLNVVKYRTELWEKQLELIVKYEFNEISI